MMAGRIETVAGEATGGWVGGWVEGAKRMSEGKLYGDGFKSGTVGGDPQVRSEQILLCLIREAETTRRRSYGRRSW